ncbi:TetR/AcrR family transcriptional regulator [Streptomyces sp. SL13]|uniref:TetR/AcrR family transcriptional regulator n=1 Tax=Streptantibioticus silvisoli TaxID=2705255 RepID=A0AA90GZ28_9ACTN|nr:TetR/AcrR family transcriptional regulator [Streptantibioticus silvisoli]MDI5963573.1 TetR/AcrR family transcriptional regulator [Streptantibioticus silvisoli]MDI5970239.1 TetR/AcrR family transcriptional regulator [Streptantibioticus silvisoli]
MNSARREITRRRLYEAAVTLIAEQGFSATTVDEIAERAGVAKGTVYYNFGGKNDLFTELLRHGVGTLTEALRRSAHDALAAGGSRTEALDAMIGAALDFVARRPAFTRLVVAELWRTNRPWQATLVTARQEAVAVLETVLAEAVERGELDEATDVPLTASAFLGMMLSTALDWQAFQPGRDITEVHAALARLARCRTGGVVA